MAKQSIRTCPVCKKKDKIDVMVQYEKLPNRYLHPECKEMEIEKFKINQIEQEKKDIFWQTLAEIVNLKFVDIPPRIYTLAQNLRSGNPVFNKKKTDKRYRDGFEWDVMTRTVIDSKQKIRTAIETKDFQSIDSALYYVMKIVVNRIPLVHQKMEREKKALEVQKAREASITQEDIENIIRYQYDEEDEKPRKKRKKLGNDISKWL
ncbi:hypothetical protein AM2_063 [Lactococcus phage AM2]|uniref:Uncharacterized protein n=7 Tax=Audreyjarvisvirus AM1 TaxID=2845188 RepID=A0A1W6JLM3_9CAUD|nr:hypothetical protein H1Z30_gp063 [Lactococcus phage AM1]ARM66368.1 hypothetical protein AM2_063 [Lactococcus phage AM2]ARM66545.1 hypothetical protein AM3_063 [Lactococcus phage AM3]ARM67098.1 hypothetical protein AM8_063 [Lactococcus phage AM8]ARM67277.1 hypothetical protein AM9_064 [Lactococcus phage AM9]ARM67455.1 hypothetical protein AM11_063 [Lactococcus phage AM11]ARQ95643.1 hypothetical protein AM12_064 [Lactococcus phage AM12]